MVVQDNLSKPHPAIRKLQQILRDRTPDKYGILVISGPDGTIYRTSKATKDRALRILDALFNALTLRGHAVATVETRDARYYGGQYSMVATVRGQEVRLSIAERLAQREHVRIPRDRPSIVEPRFDYSPAGLLVLQVGSRWGMRHTMKDGEKAKLEQLLGRAVLACEAQADELLRVQEERVRREKEEAEHARLRAIEQAKAEHQKALAADLVDMASAWVTANQIRDFLRAMEEKLPAEARSEGTAAWIAWAHAHAGSVDPLARPERIAKRLDPNG